MAYKPKLIVIPLILLLFVVYPAYAAYIFNDGFDDGTFDAWTGVSQTPTISDVQTHHGGYSCYINLADEGPYVYLDSSATMYARWYVWFDYLPDDDTERMQMGGITASTIWKVQANVYNDGGTPKWEMLWFDGSSVAHYELSSVEAIASQWNCIEIKAAEIGTNTDEARMYVGGDEVASVTGIELCGGNPDRLRLVGWRTGSFTISYYLDCVVADSSYIGPEAAGGQDLTFSLSQTVIVNWTLNMWKEKGFISTETLSVNWTLVNQRELGFSPSVTVGLTSIVESGKEALLSLVEILQTVSVSANAYFTPELIAAAIDYGLIALALAALAFFVAMQRKR